MAKKKASRRNLIPAHTRFVTVRPANRVRVGYENAPILVAWDLENCPIPHEEAFAAGAQITRFLRVHGYQGNVRIRAIWSRKNDPVLCPKMIEKLKGSRSVSWFIAPSKKKNAADFKLRKEIREWKKKNPNSVIVLISGDAKGFSRCLNRATGEGHNTMVVYRPESVGASLLPAVNSNCPLADFLSL